MLQSKIENISEHIQLVIYKYLTESIYTNPCVISEIGPLDANNHNGIGVEM